MKAKQEEANENNNNNNNDMQIIIYVYNNKNKMTIYQVNIFMQINVRKCAYESIVAIAIGIQQNKKEFNANNVHFLDFLHVLTQRVQ